VGRERDGVVCVGGQGRPQRLRGGNRRAEAPPLISWQAASVLRCPPQRACETQFLQLQLWLLM